MRMLTLNNEIQIPQLGFGTAAIGQWQEDSEYVTDTLLNAMEVGYRHFDTAAIYGNERALGRAIEQFKLPRNELFIVSKLWDTQQGKEKTHEAFERSCERLQLDYLDLYLIHFPNPEYTRETWEIMEELYDEKKIRALGVSNFRESDIEDILSFAKVKPAYNQIELHPYLIQNALVDYCNAHSIAVSCWSPLGSGEWSGAKIEDKPVSDPLIIKLAEKHNVTPAQIILKWDLQQHRIVIPKAEHESHMKDNFHLSGFTLDQEEITAINQLNKNKRFGADPATAYIDNLTRQLPD